MQLCCPQLAGNIIESLKIESPSRWGHWKSKKGKLWSAWKIHLFLANLSESRVAGPPSIPRLVSTPPALPTQLLLRVLEIEFCYICNWLINLRFPAPDGWPRKWKFTTASYGQCDDPGKEVLSSYLVSSLNVPWGRFSDGSTISGTCWERIAFYPQNGLFFYVCEVKCMRLLFGRRDKQHKMTDLYCRAAARVWHTKDQFQTVNKGQIRNTSQPNVIRPPFPHLLYSVSPAPSLFHPQLPCGHSTKCSSSLLICRPCCPAPQCAAPRGRGVGRSSGPGQVRREPITFQCCFSTLCKEQSGLISIDYRRMLIQCHADRLQREN